MAAEMTPFPLKELVTALPPLAGSHSPLSEDYQALRRAMRLEVEGVFGPQGPQALDFLNLGTLRFPFEKMGAVDSRNLFDLDELIIFSYYWLRRAHYRRVLDIGANLGLHSIMLSRCGYEVRAFEPDPKHVEILKRNIALNQVVRVEVRTSAVSDKDGEMEFVRLLGNTTGSHLAGSKKSPYGELERFPVRVEDICPHIAWADLVKLDAEGHEKVILLATAAQDWRKVDALVEVADQDNAVAIFEHFERIRVNLFAQKLNWQRVRSIADMPTSYRDGTLFISLKERMPW
jgi:FkbM family methyltransferase